MGKTKMSKISGKAVIIKKDTVCVSPMPWETPYIDLRVGGKTYRWVSDRVPSQLRVGHEYYMIGFVKSENSLARVKFPLIDCPDA